MGNEVTENGEVMETEIVVLEEGAFSEEDINNLRKKFPIWREVDIYERQLEELLEITYPNPEQRVQNRDDFNAKFGKGDLAGAWIYYPWSGVLLHTVGEDDLYTIRTNRNKNLITKDEQDKLANACLGVAGMSVGAGIAVGCAYSGIKSLKLADFDLLETANLNRVREVLPSIGQPKSILASQRTLELDPFTQTHVFPEGINENNINEFFDGLRVVVDEIDDFKMKVQLRLNAKKHRIPLLMFTSLGDNILVDIERYDNDPELQIFNGLLGDLTEEILNKSEITKEDERRYAVLIVGQDYIPTRALASLPEMGRTLVGRPQLYSTIAVDGGLAAYVVRQIILDNQLASGRYFIKFSELVGLPSADLSQTAEREEILKKMMG